MLYLSDLLLQTDPRNVARYEQHANIYGDCGVFETADGGVCRHHNAEWLRALLLDQFIVANSREITVETMNSNSATALQILATKPAPPA